MITTQRKTFVIGDVHGMLQPLKNLLAKLPSDANIVFTGDLCDRGLYSANVIKLVRDSGYKTVLGNHENTFISFFEDYFSGMSYDDVTTKWAMWLLANGGSETLQSYGIKDGKLPSNKALEQIKNDIEWMKSLPIYLELDALHHTKLPVVVSHSNITHVWHLREDKEEFDYFKDIATRGRDLSYNRDSNIVNIFGHTPTKKLNKNSYCINVDSGCCYQEDGLGKLTAYCVENDEFIVV